MKILINTLSKSTPFVTYQDSKKQKTCTRTKRSFEVVKKVATIDETLLKLQSMLNDFQAKSDTIKKEVKTEMNRNIYQHLDITNQLKREPKQKAIRKPKK